MRDPAITELEWALTYCCDELLSSETRLEEGRPILDVAWRFRGGEFRATLTIPPGRAISLPAYLRWRVLGQQFRLLPSRPAFEWHSPIGWQRAHTPVQWRRVLGNTASAPGEPPYEVAGRPVRPRRSPPALGAGAAAIPERREPDFSHHPAFALRRGRPGDERGLVPR
jgi:hypothetical protein